MIKREKFFVGPLALKVFNTQLQFEDEKYHTERKIRRKTERKRI